MRGYLLVDASAHRYLLAQFIRHFLTLNIGFTSLFIC